jgi:hypothetical protein
MAAGDQRVRARLAELAFACIGPAYGAPYAAPYPTARRCEATDAV